MSEKLDPKIWKVALVVMLGPFMAALDSTVVNFSLSTIGDNLKSSIGSVQWIVSGYLFALAMMLPLSSWLVGRLGIKRLYILCFFLFTITSIFCATANSIKVLIFFRVLQGMAAGLLAPLLQMTIALVSGKHMARAMGYTIMPVLIAPIFGPVVAGFVLRHFTWPWLFYLNIPIGILGVILAIFLLPDNLWVKSRSFDVIGFLLLSPGLALFLYGLQSLSYGDYWPLLFSSLLIVTFGFYASKKGELALVDLTLFNNPIFITSSIVQFLVNGITMSGQMIISLLLINYFHLSTDHSGEILVFMGLGMACSYPFMGFFTEKYGYRKISAGGSLLALAGTIPFLWIVQNNMNPAILCLSLFFRGMGLGAISIPSLSAAYTSVPKEKLAVATTTINIIQRIGGPIATTSIGVVMEYLNHSSSLFQRLGSFNLEISSFLLCFLLLVLMQILNFFAACRLPGL